MLKEFLIEKIQKFGPISFRDYMEDCLYHPEFGYYTAGKARMGKWGDFFTSPHVIALFLVTPWLTGIRFTFIPLQASGSC